MKHLAIGVQSWKVWKTKYCANMISNTHNEVKNLLKQFHSNKNWVQLLVNNETLCEILCCYVTKTEEVILSIVNMESNKWKTKFQVMRY